MIFSDDICLRNCYNFITWGCYLVLERLLSFVSYRVYHCVSPPNKIFLSLPGKLNDVSNFN